MLSMLVAASLGSSFTASATNIFGQLDNSKNTAQYTVTVKNTATGLTRNLDVGQDGQFRVRQLPTGNYTVQIKRGDNIVAEQQVTVSIGSNSNTAFDMSSVEGVERIQVVGARVSSIDLTTADSGLVLSDVEIDRMPVNRDITSVALLAPGTIKGDSAFGNTASFGGSSVAENACYINGLEVTNTRQGLGCGEVPFEFYDQFQVKTGGYSAKFGRATGGTINSTTKSGTNEWEFAAVLQYQPDALRSEGNISRGRNGAGQIFRDESMDENSFTDLTLSAGGPIIEDKLFFYGIVNPRDTEEAYTWGGDEFSGVDQFRTEESSGGDNLFWGAKVDWDIAENHRLSYFAYSNRKDVDRTVYEYSEGMVGAQNDSAILKRGGEAQSLSYSGVFSEDLVITAMMGNIETEYETVVGNLDCPSVTDSRGTSNPITGCGAGGSFGANSDDNTQYRLDVEYYFGDHEIAFGVDYQERDSIRISKPVAGHSYDYKTLAPGGDFQADNGALTNNTGSTINYVEDRIFDGGGSFNSELLAYYVEDKWQATDTLLLTIGLRVDEFDSYGTTGKLLTSFTTDIAPRLGFTWDPFNDGETKVYGTYGTYYLPVANNTIFRAASGVSDITTAYTYSGVDATTGAPTGLEPLADLLGSGGLENSQQVSGVPVIPEKDVFQAKEADPFAKDEYILGVEHAINDEYTVGVKGIFREVTSALDDYCGRYAYPTCVMINPGEDSSWYKDGYYWNGESWDSRGGNDGIPDPGSLTTHSASTIGLSDATNEYGAIDTMISYRGDNLRYTFTYTWSKSLGNFEGAVKSDIGQADAGITQDFDFPAVMDGAFGYQPNDRRHVFKFFGSWEPMDNLTIGWNSTLSSGRPLSLFGQGYPTDDPNLNGGWGDTFYLFTCPDTNGDGTCNASEQTYTRNSRGTAGRTPWTFNVDLSAAYNFSYQDVDMRVSLNVFNVLDTTEAVALNEHYEQSEGEFNAYHGAAYSFQTPRYVRLGFEARF
ncbi:MULTISPECIES: TonB-dependent receptor [unclassified Pseudoalteromonas]|uniref:TonB-dependent receptor n=1 Tax=unclassified Pseudoalteromonas TaxID=194690 RepID=UPI003FA6D3A9